MVDDVLPGLRSEVERSILVDCALQALKAMSIGELRNAVDEIAGHGAAEAAVLERRRNAARAENPILKGVKTRP
jgi:hypothetical protein